MADVVTSQILVSGPRNLVMKFSNVSDGTGETNVLKVDVTAFTPSPGIHLKVRKVNFAVQGMLVRLLWDASVPIDMLPLTGYGNMNFHKFGGLTVPLIAGATGSIRLTTAGQVNGSSYDITLEMTKNVMV